MIETGTLKTWIGVGGSPESVLRAAHYGFPLMLAIIDASGHGERAHEVAEAAALLIKRHARARIESLFEQL